MTIAAAYLTSEGVILGTDSTTIISTAQGSVSQVLNYAQKLFEVGESSRFATCTWGAGKIVDISHRTLVASLGDQLDLNKATVKEAANTLLEIVAKEYGDGKTTGGVVGYCLGGWIPETHVPECYYVTFEVGKKPKLESLPLGQAQFFGCPEFFTRVFHGYDTTLPNTLLGNLKRILGIKEDEFEKAFNKAFREAAAPLVAVGFKDLPIREAIDFIHTYLHITIKAFKFRFGVPICGGPIEIAFVSTDRKFRWVCHKSFERAIYEQEF